MIELTRTTDLIAMQKASRQPGSWRFRSVYTKRGDLIRVGRGPLGHDFQVTAHERSAFESHLRRQKAAKRALRKSWQYMTNQRYRNTLLSMNRTVQAWKGRRFSYVVRDVDRFAR
jgi:hypothetical protein